jgi:hypothetical protein
MATPSPPEALYQRVAPGQAGLPPGVSAVRSSRGGGWWLVDHVERVAFRSVDDLVQHRLETLKRGIKVAVEGPWIARPVEDDDDDEV